MSRDLLLNLGNPSISPERLKLQPEIRCADWLQWELFKTAKLGDKGGVA